MTERIFFARISREEMKSEERKQFKTQEEFLKYKWKQQEEAVKKHFNIEKFDKCFYDSGSAYDMNKFKNRKSFHDLLNYLFGYQDTTMEEVFWGKIKPHKNTTLYVYDYNRMSRIIEFSLLFSILCDIYNIDILSYNQKNIKSLVNENATAKGVRYLLLTVTALNSEMYSEAISKNVKKSYTKTNGITKSYKDKWWGKGFKRIDGEKLSLEEGIKVHNRIIELIKYYQKKKTKGFFPKLQSVIQKEYHVSVSKKAIHNRKNILDEK